MGKNVLIPINLLGRIIELLEYWDTSKYDCVIQDEYDWILRELNVKLKKLELRRAYANIVFAKDEDTGHLARIDYLWERNQIENDHPRYYDP